MANTTSAKIIVRKIAARTEVNRNRRSRVRTFLKKVETAIEASDQKKANEALRKAESELKKAVSGGVYKLNTASRIISRLNKKVKAMGSKKKAA